jgi:hypothetical protein
MPVTVLSPYLCRKSSYFQHHPDDNRIMEKIYKDSPTEQPAVAERLATDCELFQNVPLLPYSHPVETSPDWQIPPKYVNGFWRSFEKEFWLRELSLFHSIFLTILPRFENCPSIIQCGSAGWRVFLRSESDYLDIIEASLNIWKSKIRFTSQLWLQWLSSTPKKPSKFRLSKW